MAWTAPVTFVAGAVLTAAQLNTYLRDNFAETAPAKATGTVGSYFVGAAANSIAERSMNQMFASASDTTTSSTFTDLSGGPDTAVTVTSGARAVVFLSCSMSNNTVNGLSAMGFEVSGATTTGAAAAAALRGTSATVNANITASYVTVASLSAGSNSFTPKYSASTGTSSFGSRRVLVLPY